MSPATLRGCGLEAAFSDEAWIGDVGLWPELTFDFLPARRARAKLGEQLQQSVHGVGLHL